MNNISVFFSELLHNDKFLFYFWGILGSVIFFWESIRLRVPALTEEQLVEINPDFKGIKSSYQNFGLISIAILTTSLIMIFSRIDSWAIETYERRFFPMFVFFLSGYGIYQGTFAMLNNVYPMRKLLIFKYAEKEEIQRVAKEQITVSIVLFVLSVLSFFIIVQF